MTASHAARLEWLAYKRTAPEANAAILQLGGVAATAGLDKAPLELVKLRVSQVNGCAFCVAYHIAEAQRLGIAAEKLHLIVVWREAPQFDARERAALAWAEALTSLGHGVADAVYEEARAAFSERELAYLSSAVLAINAWNRLGVAYRFTPLPIPAPGMVKEAAA